MKQYKYMTAIAVSLGIILSGCSEDVVDNALSFPDGTPSELTLNCANTVQSLPVQADGEWSATVVYDGVSAPEDEDQWIGLLTQSGNGNGTLDFVVDANNSAAFRNATIVLASGDRSLEFKIGQQPVGYGEDNEDIDMSMFGSQVPLGFGIRMQKPGGNSRLSNILMEQVMTLNNLSANIKSAKELIDKFELSPTQYVSVDSTVEASSKLIDKESVEKSSRDILANLKVNVAYGMFKLNLNGNFRMFGASSDTTYNFSAMTAPVKAMFMLRQGVIDSDLASLDTKPSDNDTLAEKKRSARQMIFSSKFIKLHDAIEKCVADGEKYTAGTNNTLFTKMKSLDASFGPAYIASAEVGGSAELNYLFSKNGAKDTLQIHGDLTFGLNSLLSLDISASADYNNYMISHLKECTFEYRIKGGDSKKAYGFGSDLADLMRGKNQIDVATVQDKLSQWASTLRIANSTCVSYSPMPIWNLFSDEAAEELMHYFWDRYPNNGNACPYTFDVRNVIEEYNGGY